MATATKVKLNEEQKEQLRVAIWKRMDIITEHVKLEADDPRRERQCSNHRSQHCSGAKATHARGNKVFCDACTARTRKARNRIVARAQTRLDEAVTNIEKGEATLDKVIAAYS